MNHPMSSRLMASSIKQFKHQAAPMSNAGWAAPNTKFITAFEEWLNGIEKEMEKRIESGSLVKAESLDELAEKIGVPADQLKKSVDEYNAAYQAGVDTKFDVPAQFLSEVKTAPFYATPIVCSTPTIPFGLHVDNNSQVCTEEDEPIDGLFAIGNVQGDFFGKDYPVHCPGISHSRCLVFGQLVGEALAKDTVLTALIA